MHECCVLALRQVAGTVGYSDPLYTRQSTKFDSNSRASDGSMGCYKQDGRDVRVQRVLLLWAGAGGGGGGGGGEGGGGLALSTRNLNPMYAPKPYKSGVEAGWSKLVS